MSYRDGYRDKIEKVSTDQVGTLYGRDLLFSSVDAMFSFFKSPYHRQPDPETLQRQHRDLCVGA